MECFFKIPVPAKPERECYFEIPVPALPEPEWNRNFGLNWNLTGFASILNHGLDICHMSNSCCQRDQLDQVWTLETKIEDFLSLNIPILVVETKTYRNLKILGFLRSRWWNIDFIQSLFDLCVLSCYSLPPWNMNSLIVLCFWQPAYSNLGTGVKVAINRLGDQLATT